MNILFLSRWFPFPANNGSKLRIANLLRQLGRNHQVDLVSFTAREEPSDMDGAGSVCRSVAVVPYLPYQPNQPRALTGLFSMEPRSVQATFSDAFQMEVDRRVTLSEPDLVIASQIDMIPYVRSRWGIPAILEEVELTTLYEQHSAARTSLARLRYGLTWTKLRRYLASVLPRFAACTAASSQELALIREAVPGYRGHLGVVPNGVDLHHYAADYGPYQPESIVYSGAVTYAANRDAVDYFATQILPSVRAAVPTVAFTVTGSTGNVPVAALEAQAGVRFSGYLDDIRPLLAQSAVSVIPLRIGGGTRLKLLESAALGTPVVATRKGAEGIDFVAERDILIADDAVDFGRAVIRVLTDPALRTALGRSAQNAVARYDWTQVAEQLLRLVDTVVAEGSRSRLAGERV